MTLTDRNGKEYTVLFMHPSGDYFVRLAESEQTKWVRGTNAFYNRKYWTGENK